MATPSEDHLSTQMHFVKVEVKVEEDSLSAGFSRKRSRESFDENLDDSMWESLDDARPKTRRVNPQRLAIRLGPDLVAEMEALIVPGAKMPNFEIRKDFQERYCVDRRHIYDYFHSRGLRVAKEDKHTNLIRGRALKAQAQTHEQTMSNPHPLIKEEFPCERPLPRPFLAKPAPKPCGRPAKRTTRPTQRKSTYIRRSAAASKAAKTQCKLEPSTADTFFGELSSETCAGTSSSATDTDWEATSPCPQFALPCDSDDSGEKNGSCSDLLSSPDDFVTGYFESPDLDFHQPLLDIDIDSTCELGSFMTIEENNLLDACQRTELYDLISNSMPRSKNLGDSLGACSASSNVASRTSSDQLLAMQRYTRINRPGTHVGKAITSCDGSVYDPQKWLSDDLDLYQTPLDVYDYYPIRSAYGLNDLSLGDSSSGCTENLEPCYPLSPCQARNRSSLKPASQVDSVKNSMDPRRGDIENMNPDFTRQPASSQLPSNS